jgi:hypothetical protein
MIEAYQFPSQLAQIGAATAPAPAPTAAPIGPATTAPVTPPAAAPETASCVCVHPAKATAKIIARSA